MKKRVLFVVVALLASITNVAAYDFEVDGIYYNKVGGDEVSVTKGEKPYSGEVSIPSVVEYKGKKYGVTSIGVKAFFLCLDLTSVNLPVSIKSIEEDAFSYCENISSFALPHQIINIGNRAFAGCKFPTIDIPESVVRIGTGAFLSSELETVVIPNSITCISDSLFAHCYHLISITIPHSVTSIGKYSFMGCDRLLSIDIPNSVTSIGRGAFWGSRFPSITLPNSITRIPENLFHGSQLVSITIPESVTSIGKQAFQFCESLASIELPNGTTCIEDSAFAYCRGMVSVSVSKSVAQIGKNVFLDSWSLTSIAVDEGNPYYDSRNGCNALIETVSNTLLAGCMNTIIPNGIARIEESAFENCFELTSIEIPSSVTSIGRRAFCQCSALESVSLSDGLTHIEDFAFFGCTSLPSLVIPNSVKSIGDNAFCNCSSLTTIKLPEQIEDMGMGILWGCFELTSYTLPENLTTIGDYFFCDCVNLNTITIPNSVTYIGEHAFSNCSITSFIIPDGVTTIGEGAFDCMYLTSIRIPDSITEIGRWAFAGCSSMPTITIPSSVKRIGAGAFSSCYKLLFVTCEATTPPEIATESTFWRYGTLRVPAGCKNAYAEADYWKNFDIIEDGGEVQLGNTAYTDSINVEYSNQFVFSLQDSMLYISGYYAGNPEFSTKIDYNIIGHDIYLNILSDLDEERHGSVVTQPLVLDVAIEGCEEDYYFIYLSGYYGKTAIVDDYTLHETSYKGYGLRGFVREKPPKTDISTGQKDPKEQDDVDVVCRVRGIVGGHYQQRVRSKEGNEIHIDGTYNSQAEGDEDVEATTSLGRLEAGEYKVVLNVTDADDVMPSFSATLTFRVGGTGVEVISYDGDSDVIFDLQGNPASRATEGLYIVNGKKVIFR